MLSIDFDCKLQLRTIEIKNITRHRVLTSKFESQEPPIAQPTPETMFAPRESLPHILGVRT